MDQDAHLRGNDLEPSRDLALASLGPRDHERREIDRARPNLNDVVLGDAERGDIDLSTVDQHMPVTDELTSHVARLPKPSAVHDVVEPRLEDAQQVVTGLAGAAV